jgi:hypothetical protein
VFKGPVSFSLGSERIGLIALHLRWATLAAVLIISAFASFGMDRLKVDDSLSELFRSDSEDYRQFETLSERFPSSEYDVLVVIEGAQLLERESLAALRDAVIELQFVEGLRGLISIFSARASPEPGKLPPPLFPFDFPEGEAYNELIANVRANRILDGKLLSTDGQLTLIVIALDPELARSNGLKAAISDISDTVNGALGSTGLSVQLAGAPVMQQEIRDAVEHDRIIYNGAGFLIGIIIALIFFRHFSFMAIAIIPPAIAILWSLGALGWADFRLNLFLNVIAPLTMVMAFSDSMQMTFAMRERVLAGDGKTDAIRHALLVVGPGCFLSSATAGLSFLALTFADSALIRTFGTAGVICMSVAFLAVIVILPLVAMFLLGNTEKLAASLSRNDGPVSFLRRWSSRIATYVTSRPMAFAGAGLVFAILLGIVHLGLEPRYRLADQVPDREQALEASSRLDTKLTGANPVDVMVDLPDGVGIYEPQALEVIAKIHSLVEQQAGVGNVWSLETLVRWIAESGQNDVGLLQQYVSLLPDHLTTRFVTKEQDAAVVTGRIPDIDANDLLPTVNAIEEALQPIRTAYPDYGIYVSGLSVLAARNSTAMIEKINMMLTAEMIFVSAVIGVAFSSVLIGIVSLLPGLFPVFVSGASLALTGEGLQFASIIALTVAFGLGLNATVHYLNRLRLEAKLDCRPEEATARAATLIGPALIVTSIVLACGLAVTVFSDLPSLRLFGRLSATTLIAAMVAGLLLLPACMLLVKRFQARTRKKRHDSDCVDETDSARQLDPAE